MGSRLDPITRTTPVSVEQSILWNGAQAGDGAHLVRCIVGSDCSIQSNAGVFDAVIVPPKVIQVAQTLEK